VASDIDREAERVRASYARRAEMGLDARYDYWQTANLFIYQARERALLALLREAHVLPIGERAVLDAGCGDGAVLSDFLRYGAKPQNLYGVDLLPERVASAQARLPGAAIEVADAQSLPYEEGRFDLVLGFTLLSSVLDDLARQRVGGEMLRVTKPSGLLLIYDFWTNPINRHVRPLRRADLAALFPNRRIDFRRTTLAPPLTRLLMRAPGGWLAGSLLEVIPFLNTHYVAAIRA
jgi:SAM-dependent methyltransferase